MRTLEGSNRLRTGLMGMVIVLLVIGVGQSLSTVPMIYATPVYYGQFADTGGLAVDNDVLIAGVRVGKVKSIDIDGDKLKIGYTTGTQTIGKDSRAAIRTDTLLGRRNLSIEPRGTQTLRPGGVLPLAQTSTPYQISTALGDLSNDAAGLDIPTLKSSLNVLSETIDQTYPQLSSALKGVERFSDTIGKRDEQIKQLLASANKVAGVLGNRSKQINDLVVNTGTLVAAINDRGQAIDALLGRVSAFSEQIKGFVDENNETLNRALEQLKTISDILVKRKFDLVDVLSNIASITTGLGEAISSGPYFKVMLVNLLPYQILQPFVDAAFKKRGISPENFWRSAGLPEFRFPDPNGKRFPNGAPPAAPPVLEGTPENPGPAVRAGSPCSYTAAAGNTPTPGNPLPCANTGVGPFGDNPYGSNYPGGEPNVLTSPPNPDAPPAAPGVPSSAFPGTFPPAVQGIPAPLPPAPPGARTVPLSPLPVDPYIPPGSLQGDGTSPPPPALTGPPPPPGPGQQLSPAGTPPFPGNPPFLPPGSQNGYP